MNKILVCLAHKLTEDQRNSLVANYAGGHLNDVVYLSEIDPVLFSQVSNCPGDADSLSTLAMEFVSCVKNYAVLVLPIGSPAFMHLIANLFLESEMRCEDGSPLFLYAHSERVCSESTQADGTVIKTNTFKFKNWIKV